MLTCSLRDLTLTVSGSLRGKQAMHHHRYGDATHGSHERYTTMARGFRFIGLPMSAQRSAATSLRM
jgi:hypothetical protein